MRAGDLDQRIEIIAPIDTQNGAGETVRTYPSAGTIVWADIRQPTGLEQVRNGVTNTVATFSIRIRWRSGMQERCRIKWGERLLEVASVSEFGRRVAIDLVAKEVRS